MNQRQGDNTISNPQRNSKINDQQESPSTPWPSLARYVAVSLAVPKAPRTKFSGERRCPDRPSHRPKSPKHAIVPVEPQNHKPTNPQPQNERDQIRRLTNTGISRRVASTTEDSTDTTIRPGEAERAETTPPEGPTTALNPIPVGAEDTTPDAGSACPQANTQHVESRARARTSN